MPRLREASVELLLLRLVELSNDACKYPYDRDGGGFVFCGLTTMASSVPYCPEHHDLCYTPRVPKSLAVPSSLAA